MHKLALLSLVAATAAVVQAQNPCTPPNPSQPVTLATVTSGTNYYTAFGQSNLQVPQFLGSDGYAIDLALSANITLNGFSCQLFDDGDNYYAGPPAGPQLNRGVNNTASVPGPIGPTTCNVNIYECPNSWTGNAQTYPGVWTLVGTATASYTGPWSSQTQFTCTSPIFLSAGTHGIIIEFVAIQNLSYTQYNNVTTTYAPWGPMVRPSASVSVPPTHGDTFVTIQNMGWQRNTFLDLPQTNLGATTGFVDIPMTLTYTPAAGAAYHNAFGAGCVNSPTSYKDRFSMASNPTVPFDLSNSTISMTNLGTGYVVQYIPGAPAWFTPNSASLAAGPYSAGNQDDGLLPMITLPFTFPYPNGSTTQIEICTNGTLHLAHDAGTAWPGGGYYDGESRWLAKPANFCPCWGDLDTSTNPANGPMGIWYDVDPSGQAVYVTWITQEWDTQFNATRPMQVQLKMDSTGGVEYRYQTVIMSPTGNPGGNAPILVGWTPGLGAANPPITDLSASTGFITGDGSLPTTLASSARPVTGTSINLNTSNIHTGSLLGGVVLGFGPIAAGVSLAPFGAPTCSVYMLNQGPTLVFFTPTTAPVSTPLAIPANPTLAGMTIIGQSVLLCPGVNALGVLTSNGVCLGLGSF